MSTTIDQQFIEFIVKSLVGNPDAVKVERRIDEKGVLLELTVDGEDLGRVIGKRGATAQSLRTLLRALGTKNDARYNLKIIDVNGRPGGSPRSDDDAPAKSQKTQNDEDAEAPAEEAPAEEAPEAEEPKESKESTLDEFDDPDEPQETSDDDNSDVISKTRKELADLDDLDL